MPTGGGNHMFSTTSTFIQRHYNSDIPLIALMKDQVDSLKANGIVACYINSQSTEEQQLTFKIYQRKQNCICCTREFIYLENTFNLVTVSLIAIDEAHCISSWGMILDLLIQIWLPKKTASLYFNTSFDRNCR
jgi:ATP-dependent DNA helicase RecQ